jgi:protein tyrosine phosphatase (PTP) superfamily phosphohydrolase (DUF442 family)
MQESKVPTRRGALLRLGALGCLAGLGAGVGAEIFNLLLGPNFHTVLPGRLYRTSQPSGARLEKLIRQYGIRTVVNLRGACDPTPWYLDECRVTSRNDVSLEDLGCSAGRLPPTYLMRQLIDILEQADGPILVHCQRGIDRTGLVSAVGLLLLTDADLETARDQLSLRYLHLKPGRTGNLDLFLDLYEEWLREQGKTHSSAVFRTWAREHYCGGENLADIVLLEPAGQPVRVPWGQASALRVRCTNRSVRPWQFHPGPTAGIHAAYQISTPEGRILPGERAGLFHAVVRPGEHIDLALALPPLRERGRYNVRVDLIDEQHGYFFQTGSEPLFVELEVP